jgi:hypothetical protein
VEKPEYPMQIAVELFQQEIEHERENYHNQAVIAYGSSDIPLQKSGKSPAHTAAWTGLVGDGFENAEIVAESNALRRNGDQIHRQRCQQSPEGQKEDKLPIACRADSLVHPDNCP